MATANPRIQVTVDAELATALSEFRGATHSSTVRHLALRGAQALREEKRQEREALELSRSIADGRDDRFDFAVAAELQTGRR